MRWMQVGAFYPFSRNHNTKGALSQEPFALGDDVAEASRRALSQRYTLLPYLYTLFERANVMGDTVARPLFYEFPQDSNTAAIDRQFLWGSAFMIAPVLTQGAKSLEVYFPDAPWFDWYTGARVSQRGASKVLSVGDMDLPLYVRGGYVLPTQDPALTTTAARQQPFGMVAALGDNNEAVGEVYLDDGESFDAPATRITFQVAGSSVCAGSVTTTVTQDQWNGAGDIVWGHFRIMGTSCSHKSAMVKVGSQTVTASVSEGMLDFNIQKLNLAINPPLTMTFTQ